MVIFFFSGSFFFLFLFTSTCLYVKSEYTHVTPQEHNLWLRLMNDIRQLILSIQQLALPPWLPAFLALMKLHPDSQDNYSSLPPSRDFYISYCTMVPHPIPNSKETRIEGNKSDVKKSNRENNKTKQNKTLDYCSHLHSYKI